MHESEAMPHIQCVFFDVGNVILDDDPSVGFYYWQLFKAIRRNGQRGVTFRGLLEKREELIERLIREAGSTDPAREMAAKYLGKAGARQFEGEFTSRLAARYDELTPELPGVRALLGRLHGRALLGLIANQPSLCATSLKRRGLWDLFAVHGISEEVGLSKPDPAFFRWACQEAGVPPGECVMVGDRLDHDVLPAWKMGMHAVWVHWRSAFQKGIAPTRRYERLYMESWDRAPFGGAPSAPPLKKGQVVHSLAELEAVLQGLLQQGD
jgi:HAD superfamily hydrolase (TIGR01509 family)